jgi:hypothetical protein
MIIKLPKFIKYEFCSENGEYAKICHSNFCISVRYDLKQIYILLRLLQSLLNNMQMHEVPNPNNNC